MTRANYEEADRVVRRAARRYARRCWWADEEDLVQTGWLAVLRAQETFDPRVGVPEMAYLWRAAVFAMRRVLWKESSPVSGAAGCKVQRATIRDERADDSSPGGVVLVDPTPLPDALVDEKRWTLTVLARVAGATGPEHDLGLRVLLEEYRPSEVAQEAGVGIQSVYRSAHLARTAVSSDERLWAIVRRKEC